VIVVCNCCSFWNCFLPLLPYVIGNVCNLRSSLLRELISDSTVLN
jgi:hypothetical protein